MFRVGPAGWSYADWDGAVYPRSRPRGFHGLRYLTQYVDCLEVNSTFYAVPEASTAANWARLIAHAPEFRLIVKLHRNFTHRDRADSKEELAREARAFLDAVAPLRRARVLAAILVQFPRGFHHGPAEVRRIGALHSLFGEHPLVLEVRHSSWFTPPALDRIEGLGVSLAHIDLPHAWDHPPAWHAPIGPLGYLRLHGRNAGAWFEKGAGRDAKYDYLYTEAEIEELAGRARKIAAERETTYVITNNHFAGKAVTNALEFKAALGHARVGAPPELIRAYPRLARFARSAGQGELF